MLPMIGCASTPRNVATLSSTAVTAAERALHERSAALEKAESALDVDKSLGFWAQDAVIQPAGSPAVVGRTAIGDLYRYFFTTLGVKELTGTPSHLEMARSGDLAYETGVNRIVFHTATGDVLDMGKYLLVWKNIGGQWYATALSFTSDAAAPSPIK